MKRITVLAVVLLFVFPAALVMAGKGGKESPKGPHGHGISAGLLSSLNLTSEQSEKIRVLRESTMKDIMPLRSQMFNRRAEIRLLWMQLSPDPAKIKAKQKEVRDLMGQIQEKVTDHRLAFRNILTPEQITKYLALGGMRGQGFFWGKGKGRHRGIEDFGSY